MKNLILLILFFGSIVNAQSLTVGSGDIFPGIYSQRNLIKNPSCLKNALNITATSVSATANTTSSPLDGLSDCRWDPTATAQEISWAMNTMPAGLKGQNCEARIWYRGDASLVSAFVRSSSGDVATGISLTNADQYSQVGSINYPCGDGTAYSVVLKSTGNAAASQYAAYAGLATNLNNAIVVSDWTTYTPGGSWGVNTTYTGRWRRVGSNMEVQAKALTSGAPTTAALTISIPSNYSIDTGRLIDSASSFEAVGNGAANDSGTAYKIYVVGAGLTTAVALRYQSATTGSTAQVTQTTPFTFGASDYATVAFSVPIVGWTSTELAATSRLPVLPTIQRLTSGTTYTTPNGVSYIRVRMVGGGASGGSSGTASTSAGAAGTSTTFGGFTAGFGQGGGAGLAGTIGRGGTGGVNAGSITRAALGISIGGVTGGDGVTAGGGLVANTTGGFGGSTHFGSGGSGAYQAAGTACSGYGSGGAGGGGSTSSFPAGGGGSGAYIEFLIQNPATSYTISVGQGGAARSAGTSGFASSAGCPGYIEVTEFYQNANAPLLVGSVTSQVSGALRSETAYLTTTTGPNACAITSQQGSWLTGTPSSSTAGQCTFSIQSGLFSSTPDCVMTLGSSGSGISVLGRATSATSAQFQVWDAGGLGTAGAVTVHCQGPR